MAEKISMLILVVDLDCHKCYHKIRKILCQLQDHERFRTISFDNKSKTITIVGPFDPQRLACKLCCKGGKVIKDVHIVDANGGGGKPPPENMPDGPPMPAPALKKGKNKKKNKNKDKPPRAERPSSPPPPEQAPGPPPETMMMPPPSSPVHQPPPPDQGMSAMVPQAHYVEEKPPRAELEPPMSPPPNEMKPPMDPPVPQPQYHPPPPHMKERPPPLMMPTCPGRQLEQPVAEYVIPTLEIPSWPAPPVGPCECPCCAPCYQGYYDSCRCGCYGRVYGTTVRPLPPPCGAYRGCRTFSDDDPSAACTVM